MKKHIIALASLVTIFCFTNCKNTTKKTNDAPIENDPEETVYASEVIPFFDDWKLILGDGSNAGVANNFENK
ncbi:MAG: polysaccharide lyase family 7 protein, partial [Maribacter dokdonensis]